MEGMKEAGEEVIIEPESIEERVEEGVKTEEIERSVGSPMVMCMPRIIRPRPPRARRWLVVLPYVVCASRGARPRARRIFPFPAFASLSLAVVGLSIIVFFGEDSPMI